MPHKPSPNRNVTVQFVSVSLTVALKPTLKLWAEENESLILEHVARAVQLGYRITVKEEAEGYSASMAFLRQTGPNTGMVLMERGSTPERALLRLLWAHFEHFKLVWPKQKESMEDDW